MDWLFFLMPFNSPEKNFGKKKRCFWDKHSICRWDLQECNTWKMRGNRGSKPKANNLHWAVLMLVLNRGLHTQKMRFCCRLLVALQKQAISGNVFHNSVCVCGRDLGSPLMVTVSSRSIRFQKMKESQKAKHLQQSTNSSDLRCTIYQMRTWLPAILLFLGDYKVECSSACDSIWGLLKSFLKTIMQESKRFSCKLKAARMARKVQKVGRGWGGSSVWEREY